jgi:aldose 1-epimerase
MDDAGRIRKLTAVGLFYVIGGATLLQAQAQPNIAVTPFGTLPTGESVNLYTLKNGYGTEVQLTNYGGIITSIKAPDRNGRIADIVLGYDNLDGYLKSSPYFGAIVGRYANRIARGKFTLDGETYTLPVNNGPTSLHGGIRGFDKVVWTAKPFENKEGQGVVLEYTSRDGEEGYPGTLRVRVTYTLAADDRLIVDYRANADKATPVNLSQHTYWNLSGDASKSILDHFIVINADSITPVDSTLIPTGEIRPVEGTPFDFRNPKRIGKDIDQKQDDQIRYGNGYDHNFVLRRINPAPNSFTLAAQLVDPSSGRVLDVQTTEPGLQFYSGNFLDGTITGKGGAVYRFRNGLCLETQHYPDSPNHPNFPTTIVRPGHEYKSRTVFEFRSTPAFPAGTYFENQVERPARMLDTTVKPVFPCKLEFAGMAGEVVLLYVVTKDGRVDMSNVQMIRGTNELFVRAVRDALSRMTFVPAEIGGRPVNQLVQQTFQFDFRYP